MSNTTTITFEVIRISGVAMGVGFVEDVDHGEYSEEICETLYDTGNDEKDAADSEKWATKIANSLNANIHLLEALKECQSYFDNIADADHNGENFVPNKEMQLLTMIKGTIKNAEK
jgi:hypothetical protein